MVIDQQEPFSEVDPAYEIITNLAFFLLVTSFVFFGQVYPIVISILSWDKSLVSALNF